MRDVVERAQDYLVVFDEQPERYIGARGMIRELVAELKAARAEIEGLAAKLGIS